MSSSSQQSGEEFSGGPDPGGPLSDRQQQFLKLFGVLVLTAILAVRVGALWDWAWEADGIGRSTVHALTAGFNIDIAIVFPVGVVTGWLLLFVVDRTKQLQRWLALVAAVLLGVWIVVIENRWTEFVNWGQYWYFAVAGFVVGIALGVGPQLLGDGRQREYPVAAVGLFLITTTLSIVAFLDVHLVVTNQLPATSETALFRPQSLVGTTVDVVVTTAFVTLFGWFILYSDYQSVAVLSGSNGLGLATMAGLLDHTQQDYDGSSGTGGTTLSDAKDPLVEGTAGGELIIDDADQYFEFSYLPTTQPARWVHVSAAPININDLDDETMYRVGERIHKAGLPRQAISTLSDNLLPGRLKRTIATDTGLLIDRLTNADVLVFTISIEEFDGYTPGSEPSLASLAPPASLERFTKLGTQLGNRRKKIIVVTDAERLLPLSNSTAITDPGFAGFLRGQILDVGTEYTVVPVSWSNEVSGDGTETLMVGSSRLRRELEN